MPEKFVGILQKLREASNDNYSHLTTDEKLLASFVLNRSDWLIDMKFTLAEAIERLGGSCLEVVPRLAQLLTRETEFLSKRFSYSIEPIEEKLGGGFQLRLLDSGIEVGGGRFPVNGKSVQYANESLAYSQAVNTALNWLESQKQ